MNRLKRCILSIPEIIHRYRTSKILGVKYLLHVKRNTVIVGGKYIHIGERFCADVDVKLEAWDQHLDEIFSPEIYIGDNVFLNSRTHISAINRMVIGNGVLTGSDVLICDNNHGRSTRDDLLMPPQRRKLYSKGSIIIEDNVWIGDKAVILGGVTIGTGSVIGASSVVVNDIPPYSIAVGNPARIVKTLDS